MIARAGRRVGSKLYCSTLFSFSRKFYSIKPSTYGIVFDIDGVIYRGHQVIPSAKQVIKKVTEDGVPYVFLTNGGGVKEEVRANELSKMLDIQIPPSRVILSHTPCQDLVSEFGDKVVLISGGKDDECGQKVLTVNHLSEKFPQLNPLLHYPRLSRSEPPPRMHDEPIAAAMVFHDPLNWFQDLQVLLDVAMSDGYIGTLSSTQKVKFYFTNPDIMYSSQFPLPRVAQGSFRICLEALFKQFTGRDLEYIELGKPHAIAYKYAEKVLREQADHSGKVLDTIYGIGDNPSSDIKGANAAGSPYFSILVRTGIFQSDKENDDINPAKKVVQNVGEALDFILQSRNK